MAKADRDAVRNDEVLVVMFNVGEGDSLALGFPFEGELRWGLIDCCQGPDQDEPPVLEFLRAEGIEELEFICLTHLHYDHFRGLARVLKYFDARGYPIRSFWRSGVVSAVDVWQRMYDHAKSVLLVKGGEQKEEALVTAYEKRISVGRVSELREILLWERKAARSSKNQRARFWRKKLHGVSRGFLRHGEIISFDCLAPLSDTEYDMEEVLASLVEVIPDIPEEDSRLTNMTSVILLVNFQGVRLLFGGDAGRDVWTQCIEEAVSTGQYTRDELKADLVKASHHGSRQSSSVDLWSAILKPNAIVLISASYWGNPYGHPHTETLDDLSRVNKEQFSIRVVCSNAPPVCCELAGQMSQLDLEQDDVKHIVELLAVLPSHAIQPKPSRGRPSCFGQVCVAVRCGEDPAAEIRMQDGLTKQCYYLLATEGLPIP